MDVCEGSRSDPKRVRGELPSGACESFAQSLEAKLAETTAPGEPARGGGHRTLERTEEVAFPQKKALKESRTTIVFCDQFRLLAASGGGAHLCSGGKDARPQGESHSRSSLGGDEWHHPRRQALHDRAGACLQEGRGRGALSKAPYAPDRRQAAGDLGRLFSDTSLPVGQGFFGQ